MIPPKTGANWHEFGSTKKLALYYLFTSSKHCEAAVYRRPDAWLAGVVSCFQYASVRLAHTQTMHCIFGLSIIGTADDDHFHVPPCVYRLSSSIIPYGPALLSLRMIPWSATYVLCCFFFLSIYYYSLLGPARGFITRQRWNRFCVSTQCTSTEGGG